MSNTSQRAAGTAKELRGKVEGTVGKLVGSERVEAKGKARQAANR